MDTEKCFRLFSLLQQVCSGEVTQSHNQQAVTSLPGFRALYSLSASGYPRVLVCISSDGMQNALLFSMYLGLSGDWIPYSRCSEVPCS